eukprot:315229-Hanusia_phi.AAC.1
MIEAAKGDCGHFLPANIQVGRLGRTWIVPDAPGSSRLCSSFSTSLADLRRDWPVSTSNSKGSRPGPDGPNRAGHVVTVV